MLSALLIFSYYLIYNSLLSCILLINDLLYQLLQIVLSNVFFCLTAPVGIAIGVAISSLPTSPTVALAAGSLQGIACGTFLYVTFFEVSATFSHSVSMLVFLWFSSFTLHSSIRVPPLVIVSILLFL